MRTRRRLFKNSKENDIINELANNEAAELTGEKYMKKPRETPEEIAKSFWMLNSPMPEHNINTRYIFKTRDKKDEDKKEQDKK